MQSEVEDDLRDSLERELSEALQEELDAHPATTKQVRMNTCMHVWMGDCIIHNKHHISQESIEDS